METTIKNPSFVSYLTTMRMSEKGQLVLPKEFRDEQGLEPGSPIAVLKLGNSLLLLPEISRFTSLCDSVEQTLRHAKLEGGEIMKTLPQTRKEVFTELYPKLARSKTKRR